MLRILRRLAPIAALAVLAAACDRAAPTEAAPDSAPRRNSFNQAPVAVVNLTLLGTATCQSGVCTYNYKYDSDESYDPDGSIVSVQWTVNGSFLTNSNTWNVTALRAYETCRGTSQGTLTVTDDQGATNTVCFGYTEP